MENISLILNKVHVYKIKLSKDIIENILSCIVPDKYVSKTINFSYYSSVINSDTKKYMIKNTLNYLDMMLIMKLNNIDDKMYGIFLDFCYDENDVIEFKKMNYICYTNKTKKYNGNWIINYQLSVKKQYYWREANEVQLITEENKSVYL